MLVAVQREGCCVSDCAPAVGHQGGVLGWRRNTFSLTWFVGTGPFGVGQGRRADSEVTAWSG
jgi:hypothetical protein